MHAGAFTVAVCGGNGVGFGSEHIDSTGVIDAVGFALGNGGWGCCFRGLFGFNRSSFRLVVSTLGLHLLEDRYPAVRGAAEFRFVARQLPWAH